MSDENVIDFASAKVGLGSPLGLGLDVTETSRRTKKICQHQHVLVGSRDAYVGCADCGVWLEPIAVLRQFAHRERTFHFAEQHAKHELAALDKRIAELKLEERRLKARVQRARFKLMKSDVSSK